MDLKGRKLNNFPEGSGAELARGQVFRGIQILFSPNKRWREETLRLYTLMTEEAKANIALFNSGEHGMT